MHMGVLSPIVPTASIAAPRIFASLFIDSTSLKGIHHITMPSRKVLSICVGGFLQIISFYYLLQPEVRFFDKSLAQGGGH